MLFVQKKDDGSLVYPIVYDNIRYLLPNVSLPLEPTVEIDLTDHGFYRLIKTDPPGFSPIEHRAEESVPELTGKIYQQKWNLILLTEEEKTVELNKIGNEFSSLIQRYLDVTAIRFGYDSIISACSYINSTNQKFALQGVSFVKWRDDMWVYAERELAKIQSTKIIPTNEEFMVKAPVLSIVA